MENFDLHLNVTQDIGNGITIIFICCMVIIVSVLLDLRTGVKAARKRGEKICSRNLRRTISKITDYYNVLIFGIMIDVLGLPFSWYYMPYCSMIVTLCVVLIEGVSVMENYRKTKSPAGEIPDMLKEIISASTKAEAQRIYDIIKE